MPDRHRILRFFNVGPLHSLVVRLNGVQEVVGSNPAGPIPLKFNDLRNRICLTDNGLDNVSVDTYPFGGAFSRLNGARSRLKT